jgi:hypothetical protein
MKIERRTLVAWADGSCRRGCFLAAWCGVFLIAAYDMHFAWAFRDEFASWELNPLMRWTAGAIGLVAVFAFKVAALLFVTALIWHCRRQRRMIARFLTVFVVVVHAALATHYVMGHQPQTDADLAWCVAAVCGPK